MPRLLLVLLVFVLSGAPAAAVICDVILCTLAPAADGCHEHDVPNGDQQLVAAASDCSHLTLIAPSLTPPHRHASNEVMGLPAIGPGAGDGPFARLGTSIRPTNTSSRSRHHCRVQPLRI